jgi:hypothetical protein
VVLFLSLRITPRDCFGIGGHIPTRLRNRPTLLVKDQQLFHLQFRRTCHRCTIRKCRIYQVFSGTNGSWFQLNLIFLAMAVVMMCRHASASVSIKNKEHSRLASTR